jgi:hypothetical protein
MQQQLRIDPSVVPAHLQWAASFSVLTTTRLVSPITVRGEETDKAAPSIGADVHSMLKEVAASLSVCGPGPVIVERLYTEFQEEKLKRLALQAGWSFMLQEVVPTRMDPPIILKPQDAAFIRAFLRMPVAPKTRLLAILERLNTALKRRDNSDRALDCGIAVEMLLNEKGDPTSDITYRLSLRAARLLGKTLSERQAIRKKVRALYTLRSNAAHGAGTGKAKASEVSDLEGGIAVCAAVIREVVRRKGFPGWADLELGR